MFVCLNLNIDKFNKNSDIFSDILENGQGMVFIDFKTMYVERGYFNIPKNIGWDEFLFSNFISKQWK